MAWTLFLNPYVTRKSGLNRKSTKKDIMNEKEILDEMTVARALNDVAGGDAGCRL